MDFGRIISGVIRAVQLDSNFFEEVEHDESRSQEALIVVLVAVVASAIGSFLFSLINGGGFFGALGTLVSSAIMGIVTYFFWAFLIYIVGTRFFEGTADFGEVQRTLGFAWAPQVLGILSFIPVLGGIVTFVAWIWSLAIGFVATRQSLDLDNGKTALTVVIATVIGIVIQLIFGMIMGGVGMIGSSIAGMF